MIPTKLNNPPIIDTVCEIRFLNSNEIPQDLFTSQIINSLELSKLGKATTLPIMQLPEHIRSTDQNVKYAPYYKFSSSESIIQVGPRVITISSPIPYQGWANYRLQIEGIVNKFLSIKEITRIERVGLRYINFFESDVLLSSEHSWNSNISYDVEHYNHNIVYRKEKIKAKLQLANMVSINANGVDSNGSIIDIDCFGEDGIEVGDTLLLIDDLHDFGKDIFFKSLKSTFIKTFEPNYDNN